MSGVSFLEKLLDGVAVEWKTLGEVLLPKGYIRGPFGSAIKKEFFVAEGVPVYEQQHAIYDKRDFRYFIAKDRAESLKRFTVKPNDMIISCSGTIGKISIINQQDRVGVINQALLILRLDLSQVNIKFIKYYLECFPNLIVSSTGGAITNIEKREVIEKIQIPIPCPDNPDRSLTIQAEIVRILDTFTALTAELTAELTDRKKQYNYYRDRLLTFEKGEVEWKPLGEIGQVRMCKRILKSQTSSEGGIPFYKIGTFGKEPDAYISKILFEEYKSKYSYPKVGEILISASGTIGRTVIFDGEDSYFQDSNIVWIENDESVVLNKFLFYFYQIANWGISVGGTIQRLYNDNLRKLSIPIPYPSDPQKSLEEQARIVAILDKFDTLTHSISEGLPREIALRQKQYEYYRDLLLSFPKTKEEQ
ncbi:MAG: restriction endonuclease subunit S [Cyanobacteria bacterium]|nr:restriction endonuclease subunit S [Cyanobacteriota bacterium]